MAHDDFTRRAADDIFEMDGDLVVDPVEVKRTPSAIKNDEQDAEGVDLHHVEVAPFLVVEICPAIVRGCDNLLTLAGVANEARYCALQVLGG